jgi:ElaB/YqjD/DUF883 family membrane-anchored ribosome-binding protein
MSEMDNFGQTGPGGVGQQPSENGSFNSENGSFNAEKIESDVKNGVTAVKDRVTEQATELRGKFNEQAATIGTQLTQRIDNARGKTSAGLRTTSERIQNLALYMEEHDAKDMSEAVVRTSKELVRKHPGKSLIAGLLFGVLVGRIFSMGSSRRYS